MQLDPHTNKKWGVRTPGPPRDRRQCHLSSYYLGTLRPLVVWRKRTNRRSGFEIDTDFIKSAIHNNLN
jgi:hypothetical protein